MNKQDKVVKAKIKADGELSRIEGLIDSGDKQSFYLNEDKTAICSDIKVKHFKDVEELLAQLDEEHLKMVNLQITIKAMDAERTRLENILRNKPQSITSLIKQSGLSPEEIAKKLGIVL